MSKNADAQEEKDFATAADLTKRCPSTAVFDQAQERIEKLKSWLARRPCLISFENIATACAVPLRSGSSFESRLREEYEWLKRGVLNGRFEIEQATERRPCVWLLLPRFAVQGRPGRSPKLPDWPRVTRSLMRGFVASTAGYVEFPFARVGKSQVYSLADMYGLPQSGPPGPPPLEFLLAGCWTTPALAARWMEFRRGRVVVARKVVGARPGRRKGQGTYEDAPLLEEMAKLIKLGEAASANEAAGMVAHKARGNSMESKIARLARKFRTAIRSDLNPK